MPTTRGRALVEHRSSSDRGSRALAEFAIQTTIRGAVSPAAREYAEHKLAGLARLAPRPVLFARLELRWEADPALERPAIAKATLDVSGRPLRAHVAAPTMNQAADGLEQRLRRGLEILSGRRRTRHHETGLPEPGEWRHGTLSAERPAYFPRPREDRRIVRRVTFGVDPMTPEEAVVEMELLHHDFLLFEDAHGGADAVVYRRIDGSYGLTLARDAPGAGGPYVDWIIPDSTPAGVRTTAEAIDLLELTGEPFVFSIDPERGRGSILYRRYDGHYGLIEPADDGRR